MDSRTRTYVIYGISVGADLALPEFACSFASKPAITLRAGDLSARGPSDASAYHLVATTDEVLRYHPQLGTFLIEDGHRITYDPWDEVEQQTLRQILVTLCLGTAMHQRGNLVLHASAAKVEPAAVAFVGEKGQGKSTMAVAMNKAGYPLMADDIVPLAIEDHGRPHALPGLLQLKLWPEALKATLQEDMEHLPRVHSSVEKRIKALKKGKARKALPLRAIYVLTGGEEIDIAPLPKQDRFRALVQHSYLRNLLQDSGASARHFRQCTSLIQAVPVFQLARPRKLDALPAVVEAVARHSTTETSLPPTRLGEKRAQSGR